MRQCRQQATRLDRRHRTLIGRAQVSRHAPLASTTTTTTTTATYPIQCRSFRKGDSAAMAYPFADDHNAFQSLVFDHFRNLKNETERCGLSLPCPKD